MKTDKIDYYLDTNALIKRYVVEAGSNLVDQWFEKSHSFFTSVITYAEVYATFARAYRLGLLNTEKLSLLSSHFQSDWEQFKIIEVTQRVQKLISSLAIRFFLTGADLIQLASVITLVEAGISISFVTSDKRLFNAAKDYGLEVIDPQIS